MRLFIFRKYYRKLMFKIFPGIFRKNVFVFQGLYNKRDVNCQFRIHSIHLPFVLVWKFQNFTKCKMNMTLSGLRIYVYVWYKDKMFIFASVRSIYPLKHWLYEMTYSNAASFALTWQVISQPNLSLRIINIERWERGLTLLFPMHPFSAPWKHQKTLQFSDVFRG